MGKQTINLTVYGADQICASCVNAPGSKETFEWLQAAITRKFKNATIHYEYIDIYQTPRDERDRNFMDSILNEDLFYPLVVVNNEIVGEGIPQLKAIYRALEEKGI